MTPQPIHQMDDALKHRTRQAIFSELSRSSGQGIGQLSRALKINRGTISHHLSVLERIGLVESQRVSKYSLYFIHTPSSKSDGQGPAPKPEEVAVLRRRGGIEVVHLVLDRPGIIQKELVGETGMKRKVLRSLLNSLMENDLILETQVSRTRRYHPTRKLERILAFLGEGSTDPGLLGHGLDRSPEEMGPTEPFDLPDDWGEALPFLFAADGHTVEEEIPGGSGAVGSSG